MGIVENTYAELKQQELKNNPYSCLHMADIDINPHQIEAFTFALSSLELGGAILADEVGLGKTIEAGLVIKYLLCSGKNKILLIMPSNLRKQWQVELEEKFDIDSLIVDSSNWEDYLEEVKSKQAVIIVSYHFASKRKTEFGKIAWDFCVFDEAHRLRNVYKNGSKMANSLYELTKGIPKILLTATPMQNTLLDIYGLVQFIDDRVFYSKQIFSERYLRGEDYNDLKACLEPIVQRTLRKEVAEYIQFSERKEMTIDFELSPMEIELYVMINNYLKKEILYALPNSHRTLITSVIRKLLASSSMAVAETFRVLKGRLETLKETTRTESADESIDFFLSFFDDDEIETDDDSKQDQLYTREKVNEFIQHEIDEVTAIINKAESIKRNAKMTALKQAVEKAFVFQNEAGIKQRIVVFTESIRTQQSKVKSYQDLNNENVVENLFAEYQKAFVKKVAPKKSESDSGQMSIFDYFANDDEKETNDGTASEHKMTQTGMGTDAVDTSFTVHQGDASLQIDLQKSSGSKNVLPYAKQEFIKKVEELKKVAISVPKIGISYSSTITFKSFTVKRNIMDFDVAASRIERYDAVNGKLLQVLDADALIVENPENMLAVSLLESIPEFSSDDAEFILEVVDQYLALIEGTDEEKKKIVRRYATVIVEDLRKQIYASKEESTEFVFNVQKDLIVFKSFAKNMKENGRLNFKKEVPDKKNIKQYLFEGYKKSYYAENAFDSDDERRLSVVLEEDSEVIRFIKPPLNQLGLFYKAAKQYNPDFLVETADKKYMIEVKAANQTDNEDVQEKAKAAIKWCECASQVDADGKTWEYRLVPGDKIIVGNTFKYVIGMAIPVVVDGE